MEIYVYNTRAKYLITKPFDWVIMAGINRPYHHSVIHIVDEEGSFIYEAIATGVRKISYQKWIKKNIIVLEDNAIERLSIPTESHQLIKLICETYVQDEVKYSYMALLGLSIWFLIRKKTVGTDGEFRVICSEFVYRVLEEWIEPNIERPSDYVTPRTLEKWFFGLSEATNK